VSIPSQLDECVWMYMLHNPIMVQLNVRNNKITTIAKIALNILLQNPISKLAQFISSGWGGYFSLISRLLSWKTIYFSDFLIQQQNKYRIKQWRQFLKRYWFSKWFRHSVFDFSYWKWIKADTVYGLIEI
jgi:hypothetical protein